MSKIADLARSATGRAAPIMAIAVLLGLGRTHPASADWAYTRWGMTPEQVAAASKGAVHVITPSADQRDDADHWVIAATGNYKDGDLALTPGFMFDTRDNGLICVMYGLPSPQSDEFRPLFEKRYGKPAEERDLLVLKEIVWHTPDELSLDINTKQRGASVTHCKPGH